MEKSEFFRIMREEGYPDAPIQALWDNPNNRFCKPDDGKQEERIRNLAKTFKDIYALCWPEEFAALNKDKAGNVELGEGQKVETKKEMWFRVGRECGYPDAVLVDGFKHLTYDHTNFHNIKDHDEIFHRERFLDFKDEAKEIYPTADWE